MTLLDLRLGLIALTTEQRQALAERVVPLLARAVVRHCREEPLAGPQEGLPVSAGRPS